LGKPRTHDFLYQTVAVQASSPVVPRGNEKGLSLLAPVGGRDGSARVEPETSVTHQLFLLPSTHSNPITRACQPIFVAFHGSEFVLICQDMASKVAATAVVGVSRADEPRHILTVYRISPGFTPLSASEKVGHQRMSQLRMSFTLLNFFRDRCCSSSFPQASRRRSTYPRPALVATHDG
jgi:hypothetical protein